MKQKGSRLWTLGFRYCNCVLFLKLFSVSPRLRVSASPWFYWLLATLCGSVETPVFLA